MSRKMLVVEIKGLDRTINWLHHVHPKLEKALREGLKESMRPALDRARANAKRIEFRGNRGYRDGKPKISYHDSLSIASRKRGTLYLLKSTDPAAPVKEFAHEGAKRLVGKSSRSSTQIKRMRAGLELAPGLRAVAVGVPHRANAPRVMIPAVDDSKDEVKSRVEECMARVLGEADKL